MKKQVNEGHYDFSNYINLRRWNSYYYQINEIIKTNANSILLIGIGDGIVSDILRKLGKDVTTFDFDESLNPDIVGDITKIDSIVRKKYDLVVCCQVLEHIPFELFSSTIGKISNITNDKFILSLPNNNIWFKLKFKLPKIKEKNMKFHMRVFWKRKWDIKTDGNGEHYWEVDALKSTKLKNINKILREKFDIYDSFIPFNNTYHIFWVLKRR